MPEPTIEEVFGSGATQSATSFTVQKAPLAEFGLSAGATNRAEGLFFGQVAVAAKNLTEANRAQDRANRHVTVTFANFDVVEDPPGSGQMFRRDIYTVVAYKAQPNTPFDLDDY